MASYDAEESSVENSQPYEIYRFLLGSEEFLYTSAEDDVDVDGNTYTATQIRRGAILQGKSERTKTLDVEIIAANPLAQRYIGPALIYSGTVKAVVFPKDGQFAKMQVQTVEASTSRAIPRYTYMGMCNHLLYDTPCGVLQSSFTHSGTVTLVNGNEITVSGLNASGLDVVGGFTDNSTNTEKRQVLAQSGDVITVLLPFETDPTGTVISVFAGCNRVLKEDCALVFSNEINFGGFAFVPNRNPFTAGL